MTMIEKVARALALAAGARFAGPGQCVATREFGWSGDGKYLDQYAEAHWKEHCSAASFAIAAMLEPTAEMLNAEGVHTNCHMCGGHTEGWKLMIDAALAEQVGK